jgi:hypothetical protein
MKKCCLQTAHSFLFIFLNSAGELCVISLRRNPFFALACMIFPWTLLPLCFLRLVLLSTALHGRESPVVAYSTDLDGALSFCS